MTLPYAIMIFITLQRISELIIAQSNTKALLGDSHRHCPTCGAAQDPTKRYFPEPGTEVEARNHQFVGAGVGGLGHRSAGRQRPHAHRVRQVQLLAQRIAARQDVHGLVGLAGLKGQFGVQDPRHVGVGRETLELGIGVDHVQGFMRKQAN